MFVVGQDGVERALGEVEAVDGARTEHEAALGVGEAAGVVIKNVAVTGVEGGVGIAAFAFGDETEAVGVQRHDGDVALAPAAAGERQGETFALCVAGHVVYRAVGMAQQQPFGFVGRVGVFALHRAALLQHRAVNQAAVGRAHRVGGTDVGQVDFLLPNAHKARARALRFPFFFAVDLFEVFRILFHRAAGHGRACAVGKAEQAAVPHIEECVHLMGFLFVGAVQNGV